MSNKNLRCPNCGADYKYLRITAISYVDFSIDKDGNLDDITDNLESIRENAIIDDDKPDIGFCTKCGDCFDVILDYSGECVVGIKQS